LRIDKTYSELQNLINFCKDEEVKKTAKMAINTLQKLVDENNKLNKKLLNYEWRT
jgi:hypothetical protein